MFRASILQVMVRGIALFGAFSLVATALVADGLELKKHTPGQGEILEDPPLKVVLTFGESVLVDSSTITILRRDSTEFLKLAVQSTAHSEIIEALLPRKLLGGHYFVRWRAVSPHGVAASGIYPFVVDYPE